MDDIDPDTHPIVIARAARILGAKLKEEHQFLREETDTDKALTRLEDLSGHVISLARMVEVLAVKMLR